MIFQTFFDLPRASKRAATVLADVLLINLALAVSWGLSGQSWSNADHQAVWSVALICSAISIFAFIRFGLYHAVMRFAGLPAGMAAFKGVAVSALALIAVNFLFAQPVPWRVVAIYGFAAWLFVGLPRFLIRAWYQSKLRRNRENVIIYGAGNAGVQLMGALMHGNRYSAVAFVDDNDELQGRDVHGLRVYNPLQLSQLVRQFAAGTVVLALPSASPARRKEIIARLERMPVHVVSVPTLDEIKSGENWVHAVRDIDIEDLLGREVVPPRRELIERCIRDKVVMVTGAGGSIGSELCRQILRYGPDRVLLFELSEFALYRVERELRQLIAKLPNPPELVPLLGSVQDKQRLQAVMRTYRVQTVYHAAAYKHVPIVEYNIVEGVRNNVFGTLAAAEAAVQANVETFVLVSTDKAVRPTNVMGATKRLAELVLQGSALRRPYTRFCMVRFGNVLESSGSVVPLFREQIMRGGPVTVTHPDVSRYFMTIPEAAQLVLQASAMGEGGDVFVLDMGERVIISQLAKRMVRLMGFGVQGEDVQEGGISITYTGLRPGEKLFEELLIGEEVLGTEHPRILRARERALPWESVEKLLRELRDACDDMDCVRIRHLLRLGGADYAPQNDVDDLLWQETQRVGMTASGEKIVTLPSSKRLN